MPYSIYILKLNRRGIAYPYSDEEADAARPPAM